MRRFLALFGLIFFLWSNMAGAEAELEYQRGLKLADEGLHTASRIQLERFIKNFPDNRRVPQAILGIGKACYALKDLESAEYYLERIWKEDQTPYDNRYLDDLYFYLIDTKLALGKIDEADQLTQAYSLKFWYADIYAEALFRVAEAYFQNGAMVKAKQNLFKLDNLRMGQPYDVYSEYLRGMMALEEDDPTTAIAHLNHVLDMPIGIHLHPEDVQMTQDQARLKLAELHYQQEQYTAAYRFYKSLSNLELFGDKKLLGMAWCEFMLNNEKGALGLLQDLVLDYPQSIYRGEADFLQAVCYLHQQDPLFAVVHFEYFLDAIAEFEESQTEKPLVVQIAEESGRVAALRQTVADMEEDLVLMSAQQANSVKDLVLKKKRKVQSLEQGISRLYDRMAQRSVEMQLKVEAEYGLNKARLLLSRQEE